MAVYKGTDKTSQKTKLLNSSNSVEALYNGDIYDASFPEEETAAATPYDDAFHTIMQDCPKLIIPVINEIFKEHYCGKEKIVFHQSDHYINQTGNTSKELLGVSVKTLQRWDREGILKANRTPTDRRYYTYDQYLQFKGINMEDDDRQIIIYARVSTKNQKDDLQNQVSFLRQFCNAKGIIVDQCIEDYGSGLNYNRRKWNELLEEVMEQKIKTIIVTHKDRFIRFGYDWFEKFCMKFNTTIVVVNNEELSPQEELVQDIVSILHVFSCRLYGLRKYKKQIEKDEEIAKELQNGNRSVKRTDCQDQ